MSRQAVISQFGSAGTRISDIVSGVEDKKQILKRHRTISLEREIVGDTPFETIDQITGALGSALAELSSELKKMSKVCRKLKVTFNLQSKSSQDKFSNVERTFVLKNPTADPKEMLARIVNGLKGMTIENSIPW